MDTEQLVTIQHAAKELGVSESAIRNATLDGRLACVSAFNRKLIQRADLEAYRKRSQPAGAKLRGRPTKRREGTEEEESPTD